MKKALAPALALAAILAGCGGGGSRQTFMPPGLSTAPALGRATFSITIPHAATQSGIRRPNYVSTATQSVSFGLQGGALTTIALTPSSPGCSTDSGGNVTCTTNFSAPIGANQTFVVKTFASTDGSGTPLALNTVVASIIAGQVNPITVVLNGVAASLSVVLSPASVTAATASTVGVVVNALDPAGKTIVGSGNYADQNGNAVTVTLTDSDASGATTLSKTSLTAPTSGITLSYTGAAISSPTITASATGLTSATALLTANPAPPTAISTTVPIASAGGPVTLPTVKGVGASLTLGSNNAPTGATLAVTTSTSTQTDLPALTGSQVSQSVLFVSFVPSDTMTFSGSTSATFTLPSTVSTMGVQFYLAGYSSALPQVGWFYGAVGPGTLSASTLTFNTSLPLTFVKGTKYAFALYSSGAPSAVSSSVPVASSGGTSVLPSAGGFTTTLTLPSNGAASGTTLAATSTTVAQAQLPILGGSDVTPLLYTSLVPSSTISFSGAASIAFTLPSGTSTAGPFFLAVFSTDFPQFSWIKGALGPGIVSGSTVTFNTSIPLTFNSGKTYALALYVSNTSTTTSIAGNSSGATVSLPSVGGITGSVTFPGNNAASTTTFSVTTSTQTFASFPTLAGTSVNAPLLFVSLTPSAPVSFTGTTTASFTLPNAIGNSGPFYLAVYDSGNPSLGWIPQALGPGSISGQTITFSTSLPLTLAARPYGFALYSSGSSTSASFSINAGGGTLSIPSVGGITGNLTYPSNNAPGGTSLALTTSTQPLGGTFPTLSGSTITTPLLFGSLKPSAAVTLSTGSLTASFTLPSTINPQQTYYLALYDSTNPGAGWIAQGLGPATVVGSTLTFTSNVPIALNASTYGFALYANAPTATKTTLSVQSGSNSLTLPTVGNVGTTATLSSSGTASVEVLMSTVNPFSTVLTGSQIGFPLVYGKLKPSASVTISTNATITFTLPPITVTSQGPFYLAVLDTASNAGWLQQAIGPGSFNSMTGTVTFTTPIPFTLTNHEYGFALYNLPTPPSTASTTGTVYWPPTPGMPGPVPLPSFGGFGAIVTLATTAGAGTATVTSTSSLPSGLPSLQSVSGSPVTPLNYISFTPSATTTVNGNVTLQYTVPSSVTSTNLYVAGIDGGAASPQWFQAVSGSSPVSGSMVTFTTTISASNPIQFLVGRTYTFALYSSP